MEITKYPQDDVPATVGYSVDALPDGTPETVTYSLTDNKPSKTNAAPSAQMERMLAQYLAAAGRPVRKGHVGQRDKRKSRNRKKNALAAASRKRNR